jgi:predicted SnoaL-like aldol condensation-catalyzing enzyme
VETTIVRKIVSLCAAISTMAAAAPALAQESALEAANKKVAIDFYNKLLNEKDGTGAVALTAENFVDLYPGPRPGRDGVVGFAESLKRQRPQGRTEIVHAFAEGPYVVLYARNSDGPGQEGREIVEFFKVENGKLTEHWDVPAAPPGPPPAAPAVR